MIIHIKTKLLSGQNKHDQHTIAEALTIQGMSPTKLYPKAILKVLLVQHNNFLRNILAIMA